MFLQLDLVLVLLFLLCINLPDNIACNIAIALKVTAGRQSLTVVTAFVTTVKHRPTITMTANT